MLDVLLSRVEPEINCFRFYRISVEPNLFGDHSLVIHWGRLGCRGRYRIASTGDLEDISTKAGRLQGKKARRGYAPVSDHA
jgi:predicted DNA-binding WGR domain protein